MEALAAISLAGNILQFLQLCGTLFAESREIAHSVSGTTKEFENLEEICERLSRISAELVSSQLLDDERPGNRPSHEEESLIRLATKCKSTAGDLHHELQALHLSNPSRRGLASLRQAIKNGLGKPRLEALREMVEQDQRDLMFCIVALTSVRQSKALKQLEDLKASVSLVHDHSAKLRQISDTVQEIHARANQILYTKNSTNLLVPLSQELDLVVASSKRQWRLEHAVVASLFYETLPIRHESIPNAHKNTFDWLLHERHEDESTKHPQVTFLSWLESGSGIYWISGKPGSGKSTLMKLVADHDQTQEALEKWAGKHECISAAYYFWSAGTPLQRSIEGLLRKVLYHILAQHPELMPTAIPKRWAAGIAKNQNARHPTVNDYTQSPWTISELSDALVQLSSDDAHTHRFCFFIDGLDEYHGDYRDVVELLRNLSHHSRFKLCVASRPLNVFEDALGADASRKLYVHELTTQDIRQYTLSKLERNDRWRIERHKDQRYEQLADEITERAQGVFLWVVLVVRSVLEGMVNGDSILLLEQRVKEMPQDLTPFFKHILLSVSPLYHRQMALYFRVALEATYALTLMHFSFLEQCFESDSSAFQSPIQAMSDDEYSQRRSLARRRLNARCKGLLETHRTDPKLGTYVFAEPVVTFLHRTVRDFLRTDEISQLLESMLGDCAINTTMLLAHVAYIKALPNSGPTGQFLDDALVYAHKAEKEDKNVALACIDEIYRTLKLQESVDEFDSYKYSTDVCKLAVQNGLCEYVSEGIAAKAVGFQDISKLLDWALDSSNSCEPEQVDMREMIELLFRCGAELSNERWVNYIQRLGAKMGQSKHSSLQEVATRQKDTLHFLLPLVGDINALYFPLSDPRLATIAWIKLYETILSYMDDLTTPRNVRNLRNEMVELLFAHGADPNAHYIDATVWLHFCQHLRRLRSAQSSVGQLHNSLETESLAKFAEVLINAGANTDDDQSLKPVEIQRIFSPRAAGRIIEAMKRPVRQGTIKPEPNSSKVVLGGSWINWAIPWRGKEND